MTITWEGLIALVAAGTALCGLSIFVNKLMISAALDRFEVKLFERMNGRYMRSEMCFVLHKETSERVTKLEAS
jgi:hypothetical protein